MSDAGSRGDREGLDAWRVIASIPEFPLDYRETALVVIDLTVGQIARDGDRYSRIRDAGQAEDAAYAYDRCDDVVVPNARKLIDAFHANGAPVIYTTCASLRGDGSDQTWRHRAFGHITAADSRDAQVVEELAPAEGDIVLVKTGSSVFNSTTIQHILWNMRISTLVLCGVWTNSCVEGATRDAGDRDFRVMLAEDACAAMSPRWHATALEYLDRNFCHVRSTDEIIAKLAEDTAQASKRA